MISKNFEKEQKTNNSWQFWFYASIMMLIFAKFAWNVMKAWGL